MKDMGRIRRCHKLEKTKEKLQKSDKNIPQISLTQLTLMLTPHRIIVQLLISRK